MNGIDTNAAGLLASRLSGLQPVGAQGSAGPAQAGVSALANGAATLPDAQAVTTPQASTETVLSAVALALDAIVRSGGDATPAVVGSAPVWPNPGAAERAQASAQTAAVVTGLLESLEGALLADGAAAVAVGTGVEAALAAGASGASDPAAMAGAPGGGAAANAAADTNTAAGAANTPNTANAAATANTAAVSATQSGPMAALAASLQQTVSGSGLFYESHLAQWLAGQASLTELAGEPQNRLVSNASTPLSSDWSRAADLAEDVQWFGAHAGDAPAQPGDPRTSMPRSTPDGGFAGTGQAALSDNDLFNSQSAQNLMQRAATSAADAVLPSAGSPAATVHPAVVPLVRQQLDVLATGEFRWTGEAWPGVRLDWSIRQDSDDPRRSRGGADPDDAPWRTRLTLALPSLGTVDAELTLTGATLSVRVQASPGGAARLAANGDALRRRMEAAGIELGGLSIREVGAGASGAGADTAARAASAYARAAASPAAPATEAQPPSVADSSLDWEP